MSRPAIYVTANCYTCGAIVFSEQWRAAILDTWPTVANFWRGQAEYHREHCPGAHLEELRTIAQLVRMGVNDQKISQPLARFLVEALDRLSVKEIADDDPSEST